MEVMQQACRTHRGAYLLTLQRREEGETITIVLQDELADSSKEFSQTRRKC